VSPADGWLAGANDCLAVFFRFWELDDQPQPNNKQNNSNSPTSSTFIHLLSPYTKIIIGQSLGEAQERQIDWFNFRKRSRLLPAVSLCLFSTSGTSFFG